MTRAEREAATGKERRCAILRIRGFLRRATAAETLDGTQWYPTAFTFAEALAVEGNISTRAAAGVLAAISPGLQWERNLICARSLVIWNAAGRPKVRKAPGSVTVLPPDRDEPVVETYQYENVRRALRILDGETPESVLSGPKVVAFYHAILGEDHGAVLDGHVANALRGESHSIRDIPRGISVVERKAWTEAFEVVGAESTYGTHAVQAIAWLVHKREKGNRLPF